MSIELEVPEGLARIGVTPAQIAEALADVDVRVELFARAHEVADYVRNLTPEFDASKSGRSTPGIGEPGDAKAAIQVIPLVDRNLVAHQGYRVISQDPKANWIEFGSSHMPEYAPFQQAIAHFGGEGGPGVIPAGHLASTRVMKAHQEVRVARFRLANALHNGVNAERIGKLRSDVQWKSYVRSREFKAERQRQYRGSSNRVENYEYHA